VLCLVPGSPRLRCRSSASSRPLRKKTRGFPEGIAKHWIGGNSPSTACPVGVGLRAFDSKDDTGPARLCLPRAWRQFRHSCSDLCHSSPLAGGDFDLPAGPEHTGADYRSGRHKGPAGNAASATRRSRPEVLRRLRSLAPRNSTGSTRSASTRLGTRMVARSPTFCGRRAERYFAAFAPSGAAAAASVGKLNPKPPCTSRGKAIRWYAFNGNAG
jgi:hypothetical protein